MRAKLQKAKSHLLSLLSQGEEPCRRLFLDYHGLKLMHSWMSDISATDRILNLTFRLEILQTLDVLPIINKTMLQDSKVLSTVQRWADISEYSSFVSNETANATNDESSPSDSGSGTPISNDGVSSPKIDDTTSVNALAVTTVKEENVTTQLVKEENQLPVVTLSNENITIDAIKDSSDTTSTVNLQTTIVQTPDVLEAIPQILEQNATIKGMGVDLLKRIISTNKKNTKIIEDSEKLPDGELGALIREICLLASKLVTSWEQLPESFKIPKKLRIEQMKEHEREADQSYKDNVKEEQIEQKSHSTFTSSGRFTERVGKGIDLIDPREKDPREKDPRFRRHSTLSKHQRRQLFEAKVKFISHSYHKLLTFLYSNLFNSHKM